MATIDVNDTTLYYEHAGDGPAILYVHGMCGDADVWADQARGLEDRYTCVRYDRRGHSRSARGDATISDSLHADDAAALIETLGLAPCLIVGSSGGAAIAVEVALRHGHLLRGVVFSEPPLFCLDRDAGRAVMNELVPRLEAATAHSGPGAAVDAFFSLLCPGLWAILDEDRKDRYRDNADIGFTDLRSPSLDVTADDLAGVTLPVLVLAGDRSHPSLRSVAYRLAAALPDARFVELTDCGHVTYAEQPDAFAGAVSVFAAEIDSRMTRATSGDRASARRFDVRSVDGTSLAVWVEGSGPPLVLVHGSIADHTTFDPFVDVLRDEWTSIRWTAAASAPAATPAPTRSSGTSKTSPSLSTPWLAAPADLSRCGATPTVRTAPWAAPPAPATSTTSCSTNRASDLPIRPARSNASRRRSPRATTKPPSSPCSSTSSR
jgi:3-oxoadipate enol-lactonase